MIQVFQVQLTDARADEVNAAGCWSKVAWGKTYLGLTDGFLEDDEVEKAVKTAVGMKLFQLTRFIDTESLDEAFAVGNGYGNARMETFCPAKSISVGDVLVDGDGVAHMVARFGFTQLSDEVALILQLVVPTQTA